MIKLLKSIKLFIGDSSQEIKFFNRNAHQIDIDFSELTKKSTVLHFEFIAPITHFRNHDYTWSNVEGKLIANWYTPKILKLENNHIVQANQYCGIWEVDENNPRILLWCFNVNNSAPLAQFNLNNNKYISNSIYFGALPFPLALLFPKYSGVELSRSKIAFSAIVCFTDHCDFDTQKNLRAQRKFFKKYDIKITKGFFLNYYSKRSDTASVEFHISEFKKWIEDGHELAYHSLSQSVKLDSESFKDFKDFKPPFDKTHTYIDHGFQPYNFSLYKNHKSINLNYGVHLRNLNIKNLWNYIDTGTATQGVINQLNPQQFVLKSYYRGIKEIEMKNRLHMLIKTIVFHYSSNYDYLFVYGRLVKYFKPTRSKKSVKKHFSMISNLFKIFQLLLPILLFWKTKKNRVYPLAVYNPVIFQHKIDRKIFNIFQTLEMVDFKNGLSKRNIDLLIKEKGLFIAHTYFSDPLSHHRGKLFRRNGEIDDQVEENFAYMSKMICSKNLWNPTLEELISHLLELKMVMLTCNELGEIMVENSNGILFRNAK